MFGLSTMWIKGLAALALLVALLAGVKFIYNRGYDARDAEAVVQSIKAQGVADKAKRDLTVELAAIKGEKEQERKNAKQEIDSLRVQLASGAVRLRIAVAAPSRDVRGASPGAAEARAQPGQTPAAGPAPESGGVSTAVMLDLDPATSIELLSIAADGDAAIRDLNECLASYEALRKSLHGLQRTD